MKKMMLSLLLGAFAVFAGAQLCAAEVIEMFFGW